MTTPEPNVERPPPPQPPPKHNPHVPLAVDGLFGPGTIKALQFDLGVTADGDFGPLTRETLQFVLGVTQDGDIGPVTIRALQVRIGDPQVDGEWYFGQPPRFQETTRHLQIALNDRTL